MKGARLRDRAHPLVVELLCDNRDHSGAAHAIEACGMGSSRGGNGVLYDDDPKTLVEQAEGGLRHADIGFEADEHSGASPGFTDGRADEWIVSQPEDDLAQHGGIADGLDQFGVEATPVVRRLHRGDHRDLAVARALDEEGDAFEQTGLGRVFDTGQKICLHVDDDEDGVIWVNEAAHGWMLVISRRVCASRVAYPFHMALTLPIVWNDACLLHAPGAEIWLGVRMPDDEGPERVGIIRDALVAQGAQLTQAEVHPDEIVLAVHNADLVDFLRTAWTAWGEAGLPTDPGQDLVVPYLFPTTAMLGAVTPHRPEAVWARTGYYCFDTMTPIAEGTWAAARGAVDATLTAVDLVRGGAPLAYAITRPPGHHVSRGAYGGSCYLNNAAIAVEALRAAGAGRVALVDIDAHHGNGAQEIFWERGDVLTTSIHVDPAAGWFPHVMGWADEVGGGHGEYANRNVPLSPGSGDGEWLVALDQCLADVQTLGAEAIVLALGVDAATGDPNSPLNVTPAGYHEAGRRIGALGLPIVAVQEGGYDLPTLGGLVTATIVGLEEGMRDG